MDMKEAIQELGNVVNHCSYLMPKEWRERHLEDAKEAIRTLTLEGDREWAEQFFRSELESWKLGVRLGTACEDGERYIRAYQLALEGLEKL